MRSYKITAAAHDVSGGGAWLLLDGEKRVHVSDEWIDENGGDPTRLVGKTFVNHDEPDRVYDPKDGALPVSGYKPQTESAVKTVNGFKELEERTLRCLDELATGDVDKRWLAIGRTQMEQAWMAINRSVFQPGRVKLPEDKADA